MSCHKTYWLTTLAASLKLKPKVSLAVKERVLYTPCIDCVPETSITFTSSDSFSHNSSLDTQLLLTSGGSHLQWDASSQSFEGYLVDSGKGKYACVFTETLFIYLCPCSVPNMLNDIRTLICSLIVWNKDLGGIRESCFYHLIENKCASFLFLWHIQNLTKGVRTTMQQFNCTKKKTISTSFVYCTVTIGWNY